GKLSHKIYLFSSRFFGLSDICCEEGRILGWERAYARSHPKMRGLITGIPKEPFFAVKKAEFWI
ncbi:MAG: hypothetical protein R6W69_09200, partial [Anaerolineales bacterium]